MTEEILLYLRLVMYPLAALALTFIAIIRYQDENTPKGWIHLMTIGVCLIMSFFLVELFMTLNPNIHEQIKSYILTPIITLLAIGGWTYVFKIGRDNCIISKESK